jgi:hypothetical protein
MPITFGEVFSIFFMQSTPLLQKSEAFSLRVGKGEAVVGYCDPLLARWLGASGFPAGEKRWKKTEPILDRTACLFRQSGLDLL